jgi:hypothetical protein
MTKPRLPILAGLDELLQEQALEMATLRAARSHRHDMQSERPPKWYRLGPENPDGSLPIDVAERGGANWRKRETCANVAVARQRVQQLMADDAELFRAESTADGDEPRIGSRSTQ